MRRIFASTRVAFVVVATAAPALNSSAVCAQTPLLDPGWQIAYPPGNFRGGFIQNTFGDGTGQPVVQRPYQPAPVYYQRMPAAPDQPRDSRAATANYRPYYIVPAQQARAYQQAAPQSSQTPSPPPSRAYQPPVPEYYVIPAQQLRAYQQPVPQYYTLAEPQARPGYQPAPTAYQQPTPPQPDTGFFGVLQPPRYQPAPAPTAYQQPAAPQPDTGLFGLLQPPRYQPAPAPEAYQQPAAPQLDMGFFGQPQPPQQFFARTDWTPAYAPSSRGDMAHPMVDPKYDRQVVDYPTEQPPGTIVIDTPHYFLYLVMEGGKALRYGIGVGRPGYAWAGVKEITAMREWPDWRPPDEMIKRRPDLPRYMAGGPINPLGARALYLGSTLYRIHGSNEPWTIGTQVSSGCIRLRNEDVIDLYGRVKVGAKVVVI